MNTNEAKKIRNKIANKNKLKKWQIISIAVAGSFLAILAITAITLFAYHPSVKPATGSTSGKGKKPPVEDNSLGNPPQMNDAKRKDGVFNFLSIGCDKKGLNTDSIMIISYDTKNKKASIAQIPRDSYVQIDGKGGRKINSVFAKGYISAKSELENLKKQAANADKAKLETLCKNATIKIDADTLKKYASGTVEADEICTKNGMYLLEDVIKDTFGIMIDYTVYIDLEGFKNMVDIIGGVEVTVPQDMDYDDPAQSLFIHLKAGKQLLNGDKAEQFVRFRHGYANADLGRIDAQKLFMTAFMKKMVSSATISKMPKLVNEFNKYVVTDMNIVDAAYFGKSALSLDLSTIQMMTWPGVPKYYNGASYFSLNKPKSLELVNKLFNVYTTDVPESALAVFELVKSTPTSSTTTKSTSTGTKTTTTTKNTEVAPAKNNTNSTSNESINKGTETNNTTETETVTGSVSEDTSSSKPTTSAETNESVSPKSDPTVKPSDKSSTASGDSGSKTTDSSTKDSKSTSSVSGDSSSGTSSDNKKATGTDATSTDSKPTVTGTESKTETKAESNVTDSQKAA